MSMFLQSDSFDSFLSYKVSVHEIALVIKKLSIYFMEH